MSGLSIRPARSGPGESGVSGNRAVSGAYRWRRTSPQAASRIFSVL